MKFPCLTWFKVMHLIRRASNGASVGVEEPEADPCDMNTHPADIDQCPDHFISAGRYVAFDAI